MRIFSFEIWKLPNEYLVQMLWDTERTTSDTNARLVSGRTFKLMKRFVIQCSSTFPKGSSCAYPGQSLDFTFHDGSPVSQNVVHFCNQELIRVLAYREADTVDKLFGNKVKVEGKKPGWHQTILWTRCWAPVLILNAHTCMTVLYPEKETQCIPFLCAPKKKLGSVSGCRTKAARQRCVNEAVDFQYFTAIQAAIV